MESNTTATYATVIKKKKPQFPAPPIDYKPVQLNSARFDTSSCTVDDVECYRLTQNIIYPLSNADLLKCFCNSHGLLCIFKLPDDDVTTLNSLIYELVQLKGISNAHVHYLRHPNDKNNNAEFIRYDRNTRIFNREGKEVFKSDFINVFHGRVALAIKGLRVMDDVHIFAELSVHQVKIEEEEVLHKQGSPSDCMFD
jgi:hypothetical protein